VKLFRFPYSCYALKAQCLLELAGVRVEAQDVPYGDRSALVELTGGYMHVPVLVDDAGSVHVDSRAISELIIAMAPRLVPAPLEGPVWAYADWCDLVLEDSCFKLSAPGVRRSFPRAADRALYALIKERKYGAGCVELWEQSSAQWLERARERQSLVLTVGVAGPGCGIGIDCRRIASGQLRDAYSSAQSAARPAWARDPAGHGRRGLNRYRQQTLPRGRMPFHPRQR